ncbi:uncharacterized protein [Haliotis asinina]|uniref:uncharacterized protein n=1 Tax=Haliotis asinina TaxID=109174 RepID=UPI0035325757
MTKKNKQNKYQTSGASKVRVLEDHPLKHGGGICPTNLKEQKERFLRHGKTPDFHHTDSSEAVQELTTKSKGQIRFDLLSEAEYVLETVRKKFGGGENFLAQAYGKRLTRIEASEIVTSYLEENLLNDALTLIWCNDLPCSARMVWQGPLLKCNRPEARKYSLWLNGSLENPYVREQGIGCLMDHEVGTHFFRMYNDGLQPWFSDRKRFGLRGMSSFEGMCTEEGLAAIHTALRANSNFLFLPALVYYTACKSAEMTFKQLFDHLGRYISNREQRWKHVMRVKRGLLDPNDLGGYGKDQCYFEGAVRILRSVDAIDFHLLMSGKICIDEIPRIKRIARMDCVRIPCFMKNVDLYKRKLHHMAEVNGLHIEHPKVTPPLAYIKRLKQRQSRVGVAGSSSGTRRKVRKRFKKKKSSGRLTNTKRYEVKIFLPPVGSQTGKEESKNHISGNNMECNRTNMLDRCGPQTTKLLGTDRQLEMSPSSPAGSSCDSRVSSSLSDTQLLRGLPPFPYRVPLPPINSPRQDEADIQIQNDRAINHISDTDVQSQDGTRKHQGDVDEASVTIQQKTEPSSSTSQTSEDLQLNSSVFPDVSFTNSATKINIQGLHIEDHFASSSDGVTSNDDDGSDDDEIY